MLSSVLALPASLAGLDLADATRALDRSLHAAGARTSPPPEGLGYVEAKFGRVAMATTCLVSDRIERAVLTHVRVAPFFASTVLVVHPRADLDAPILVADLHVVPTGRARAFLDACGPAVARASFREGFLDPLLRAQGRSPALEKAPPPAWIAPISGGAGAVVRARGRSATQLFGLVRGYVETYLAGLACAPVAQDPAGNLAAARSVGDVVRAHGKAGRMLSRAFGPEVAARYQRLVWER